jgi:hypothetical protein
MWLAGAGVRGGFAYGSTDDFGFRAVSDKVHIHDLHATILFLLGLDHERLTYRHASRDFRLTDVSGRVVREILRSGDETGARYNQTRVVQEPRSGMVSGVGRSDQLNDRA